MAAARMCIQSFAKGLGDNDRHLLEKAGIYREKLSIYRRGHHLPNSVSLIACLVLLRSSLELIDPETGTTLVLTVQVRERQMRLPL